MKKGIDVSVHQGDIDWKKVKESGMEFAIIRLGFRGYESGKIVLDNKFEDNRIIYTDDFYKEYEGYTKDEASETTFYRYITNQVVYIDANNNIVTDDTYCSKYFCYAIRSKTPEMIDMVEKSENKYEDAEILEIESEVVPMTGDKIIYSVIFILISLVSITYLSIKKYKSMSNE